MLQDRKKVLSWAFYDWANSAYSTTVMAGFFPIFFEKYWSNPDDVIQSTYQLGIANSISSIIIALVSPILGAIADRGSAKKKLLITFAFLGVLMTSGLWFVQQGEWKLALFFYVIASIGFMAGNIFYDSLLPSVASRDKVDYVSSLGYSLGYLGGGLLFLVNVLMYLHPDRFGIPDSSTAIRLSFVSVAIWWGIFTLPVVLFLPEPTSERSVPLRKAISSGFLQLRETYDHIREMKVIGTFLLAYWLYEDGVATIVRMAVKVGSSMGFAAGDLITAILMVQFIGFPAAILYHWFGTRIGVKNAVLIAIGGYGMITLLGYFMTDRLHFYLLASLIGIFQGGIQALSRSLFTRLVPKNKEAEFFGFYNMLGKFAAVIGPVLMGWITVMTGNPRMGILSIVSLFILGGLFLRKVDFEEGERIALEFGKK
jgi:UMF1 family MFS transporter|tara:strand:- start:561 stop:1838 length:1278 start_codon:yes stop_codon:yes gene_type:complete